MNHEDFLGLLVFGLSRGTVPPRSPRGAQKLGEEFPRDETVLRKSEAGTIRQLPETQFWMHRVIAGMHHLLGGKVQSCR